MTCNASVFFHCLAASDVRNEISRVNALYHSSAIYGKLQEFYKMMKVKNENQYKDVKKAIEKNVPNWETARQLVLVIALPLVSSFHSALTSPEENT